MVRRALVAAVLLALLGACTGDGEGSAPTTFPVTTRVPTPVDPPGMADAVRQWVALLGAGETAAFDRLGPRSRDGLGGREGYPSARPGLERTWGPWAEMEGVTYDGLPVDDGLGVVVVSATDAEGDLHSDAVPVRLVADRWAPEPLLDAGPVELSPEPGAEIASEPVLTAEVDRDVALTAFVDEQPTEIGPPASAGDGRVEVTVRPSVPLRPGLRVVTLVARQGEAVAARTAHYEVPDRS